jgi:hypothetical protein
LTAARANTRIEIAVRATANAATTTRLSQAIVNGAPGVVVALRDQVLAVSAFTTSQGRITSINLVGDPDKLKRVQPPPVP